MEGNFDRKRRRAKMVRFNWAKSLLNPITVRLVTAVLVGITKVILALYKLYSELRN